MTGSKAGGRTMAKRRRKNPTKTPGKRRIAAGQALIRRCHTDREFRKKMIALWRAQMEQDTAVTPGKNARQARSE